MRRGALAFLLCLVTASASAQANRSPATREQISALVERSQVAVTTYEATIPDAERMLGPDEERQSFLQEARLITSDLSRKPEKFNTSEGFSLIVSLSKVRLLASTCTAVASLQGANEGIRDATAKIPVAKLAYSKLELGRKCLKAEQDLEIAVHMAFTLYEPWLERADACAVGSSR